MFIPFEKLSKKLQKEYNKKKRKFWDVKPLTTKIPSKKDYNRRDFKRGVEND